MFNFLVTAHEGSWNGEPFILDKSRFLEYTDDDTRFTMQSLSDDVKKQLTTFPTLFAYEKMVGAPARIGWIRQVQTRGTDIRVVYEIDSRYPSISHDQLLELGWDLEIGPYELNRTHWAVKRAELLNTLGSMGLGIQKPGVRTEMSPQAHPSVSRRDVISASQTLQALGHSGFDRMLLEFGVPGLEAGRDRGGLLARANALAAFALDSAAVTADGVPLTRAIVDYAATVASERGLPTAPLTRSWGEPAKELAAEAGIVSAPEAHEIVDVLQSGPIGTTRAFVGHGGSPLWRELREFLESKLKIKVQEFNSSSVVGLSNKERLVEILNSIDVGFVVLTAEDEQSDGKRHPRMNVIHEVGLLQGKLGFERVVILLEDGCEEFSNIQGVGQIRFSAGDITSAFEGIRDFLIREGLG